MSVAESNLNPSITYTFGLQVVSALLLSPAANSTTPLNSNASREFRIDSSAGNALVQLPAAPDRGLEITLIMQAGTNRITVSGNGNTINGSATFLFTGLYRVVTFKWSGVEGAAGASPQWIVKQDTTATSATTAAVVAALAGATSDIDMGGQQLKNVAPATGAGRALVYEQGGLPFFGGSGATGDVIGAATKYLARSGNVASSQVLLGVVTRDGLLRNLRGSVAVAPGGTETVIITVQKSSNQGGTWSDTTLNLTITGNAKSGSNTTDAPPVSAGDWLAIKTISSAGTAAGPVGGFELI